MTAMTRLPKIHYADSFNFIKSFLEFSPAGLPVDPSVRTYYQRRIAPQHRPEVIGFSVFLHVIWQCFAPVITCIHISGIESTYQPDWIPTFWPEPARLLIDTTESADALFTCQVFDLRGTQANQPQMLTALTQIQTAEAAVFLVTDEELVGAQVMQHTLFGVVSFFNKNEWEAYCENLV